MANSAVIGLLRVLLSANSAEFEAAMKKSADSAKAWSRDLKQIGQQATQVGAALTKTLTLPIAGVGIAAAKLAMDFESSFAGVRKTVDATEPQLAVLATGFRNLSKTIPINVNELNKIGEAAGQLGIKREQIIGFTEVMAKLGVTTNLSATEAATSLARFANIMDATKVKAGTFEFDRLGATIVDLGNNFATTEAEIVEFGTRIAGAGKIAGLTEHQVLAIGAAMSSVGIEAEAGGTAVQKVLNKMTESVATGDKSLAVFAKTAGMSAKEFAAAFRDDAGQAFAKFVQGIGTQGDAAFGTLKELKLGNERVIRSFLSLGNAGELLNDTLRVGARAWQSNTALTKEAEERFKTTHSQLTLLGNRVKDVGITLGNALGPAIGLTIRGLNTLIPVLEKMAGMFAALPAGVQLGIVGFAGIVAAAGPVIYIFGQLALSASALTGAFAAKGLASRVLMADLAFLGVAMKANIVSAAAMVTQYGALGAASIGLATASRALGAAIMAMPWAAAAAGVGILTAAVVTLISRKKELELVSATQAAKQDTINRAIKNGAAATISYADAIKFNTEWEEKRINAFNRAHRGANSLAEAQAQLNAANAKYKSELTGIEAALKFQIQNMGATGKSAQDLAKEFGISELTVTRFKASLEGNTGALRTNTGATNENTGAKAKAVALTSEQVQVLDLLAKAHAHETSRLEFETAAWKQWEQTVSKALSSIPKAVLETGITGLDPNKLYTPKSIFDGLTPRHDVLGPIGLDPSKINMGEWAKGIPDSQRQSFWSNLLGDSAQMGQQLAQTIVGAFQGGGSALKSGVSQLGSMVGKNLGDSLLKDGPAFFTGALGKVFAGAIPVVGSLIGPLAEALWGKFFGTSGRDTKLDLAKQMFGSVEEMQQQMVAHLSKVDYDRLWKQFSEVGQNNKGQAVAAIDAITAALARQKAQTEEVAAAAAATATVQQEALDAISAKYAESIGKLKGELDSFAGRLQAEADAPEFDEMGNRIYGVQEQLDMARKADLEQQIKNAEEARDAEIAAKKDTFAAMLEDGISTAAALRAEFARTLEIPYKFIPAGALSASYDAGMLSGWESRVPAAALAGGGGGGTAQFIMDGRTVAEITVPHIPGVVARLGLAE